MSKKNNYFHVSSSQREDREGSRAGPSEESKAGPPEGRGPSDVTKDHKGKLVPGPCGPGARHVANAKFSTSVLGWAYFEIFA